jgi:hypothetical protein
MLKVTDGTDPERRNVPGEIGVPFIRHRDDHAGFSDREIRSSHAGK